LICPIQIASMDRGPTPLTSVRPTVSTGGLIRSASKTPDTVSARGVAGVAHVRREGYPHAWSRHLGRQVGPIECDAVRARSQRPLGPFFERPPAVHSRQHRLSVHPDRHPRGRFRRMPISAIRQHSSPLAYGSTSTSATRGVLRSTKFTAQAGSDAH
jgi:hypothetical protein